MVCSTFLEDIRTRIDDCRRRADLFSRMVTEEQLNAKPSPDKWSIAQILDHMMIAQDLYLPAMEIATERGTYGPRHEAKHTLLGRFIIHAGGPDGNAPVPTAMTPGNGPFTHDIFRRFDDMEVKLLAVTDRSEDVDLSRSKVRMPLMPILTINLADSLELAVAHQARHLGQIDERLRTS